MGYPSSSASSNSHIIQTHIPRKPSYSASLQANSPTLAQSSQRRNLLNKARVSQKKQWNPLSPNHAHHLSSIPTKQSHLSPMSTINHAFFALAFFSRASFKTARRFALISSRRFFFSARTTCAFSRGVCMIPTTSAFEEARRKQSKAVQVGEGLGAASTWLHTGPVFAIVVIFKVRCLSDGYSAGLDDL